jgi:hypothetical protein
MTGASRDRGMLRERGTLRDRGSVLMLVPAGFLVVLVMASIAVDMSLVHLRQRQAHDLAAGAANDAATAALDRSRLRGGERVVDAAAAQRIVEQTVAASELSPDIAAPPIVRVTADGAVEVEIALDADYIFAGVVPGAPDGTTVTATASAAAVSPTFDPP